MSRTSFPRRAVVGLDRGRRADHAVAVALDLQRTFGTHLHYVHAVDLPDPEDVAGRPEEVVSRTHEIVQVAGRTAAARLAELGAAADDLVVRRGRPTDVLLAEVGQQQADLVLLGPHQRRSFFDLGRTGRAVLAQAQVGVWVQKDAPTPVRRILVPVDLSEDSLGALDVAQALARGYGAELTALHVHTPVAFAFGSTPGYEASAMPAYVVEAERDAARAEFEQAMKLHVHGEVACAARFVEGHAVDGVLEAQQGHDLIVLGTHGRSRFAAAVLGSVAYSVLKDAHLPVLALRHPERMRGLGAG